MGDCEQRVLNKRGRERIEAENAELAEKVPDETVRWSKTRRDGVGRMVFVCAGDGGHMDLVALGDVVPVAHMKTAHAAFGAADGDMVSMAEWWTFTSEREMWMGL